MASKVLGGERIVRIYLPPSYESAMDRRFPVLYVHDGQNAFSTVGTNVAFGWGNWELDLTTTRLIGEKKLREIILVAVDASNLRYEEYRGWARPLPQDRPADESTPGRRRSPYAGDNTPYERHAKFLVEELKPKIDREYRTLPGPADTATLGSSMGGICSVALAWRRPDVFGSAASFSGAFQVENRYFISQVLRKWAGSPKPFRLYIDSGVTDYTGGDDGAKDTKTVADLFAANGWTPGTYLMHYVDATPLKGSALASTGLRADKWDEAGRSQHNEFYWRLRAWRALTFLFPPDSPQH